ncbi:hypothetical protein [Neptunicella sp. SCSIO 80796]|uniref:hypothetical protein n=1 Tax=Neptunicella plasticusilytica TaxID=3117012 RepID=UPI003A4E157A
MSTKQMNVKRISSKNRKDPLIDLDALDRIGRAATKNARVKAFNHGSPVTIAQRGDVYRLYPDGRKERIKSTEQKSFPRIEDDLCQVSG